MHHVQITSSTLSSALQLSCTVAGYCYLSLRICVLHIGEHKRWSLTALTVAQNRRSELHTVAQTVAAQQKVQLVLKVDFSTDLCCKHCSHCALQMCMCFALSSTSSSPFCTNMLHLSCAQQGPLSLRYVFICWLPHREASAMPGLALAFNLGKLQQLHKSQCPLTG